MLFEVGSILLVKDFRLPSEIKDKFFVVLDREGDDYALLSMTTSQQYVHGEKVKHGTIEDGDVVMYCFLKDVQVGINGFAFRKNTFVSTRSNTHVFTAPIFDKLKVELVDVLMRKELTDIVYCFYKSKHTPRKYIKKIESKLNDLIG